MPGAEIALVCAVALETLVGVRPLRQLRLACPGGLTIKHYLVQTHWLKRSGAVQGCHREIYGLL
jgi:hypothetical protein